MRTTRTAERLLAVVDAMRHKSVREHGEWIATARRIAHSRGSLVLGFRHLVEAAAVCGQGGNQPQPIDREAGASDGLLIGGGVPR